MLGQTLKPFSPDTKFNRSYGSPKGINLEQLSQLLKTEEALTIKNYVIDNDGKLIKRKGYEQFFTKSTTDKISALAKWKEYYLFSYSTYLKAYDGSNFVDIKTFSASITDIIPYGDYAFVASGKSGDKIHRISFTLNYDTQTANFTVGQILTGGTSGATAVILEDSDSGATGTLTLGNINGTFQNNEIITDEGTGSATSDGVVTITATEISAAPKCEVLKAIGPRLYAGNTDRDTNEVRYSEVDDATNPPFNDWTEATGASDGGSLTYRNGGEVKSIAPLGQQVVIFYENGKAAFRITTIDSGGTLTQDVINDFYKIDFGGERGAITTPKGIFYANEGGLWQLLSGGNTNQPYSDNEAQISRKLGNINDYNFDDVSIAYYQEYNSILFSCKYNSETNNRVLVYNLDNNAWSYITGWQISRFLVDNNTIYGGESSASNVNTLFTGYQDGENDIWTEYYQELNVGNFEVSKMLKGQYIQGRLSGSTEVNISFDIYDKNGSLINNKIVLQWSGENSSNELSGWGTGAMGTSAFGGDEDEYSTGLSLNFVGGRFFIRNFYRIFVRLTENSKAPHEINWISLETESKAQLRKRELTEA